MERFRISHLFHLGRPKDCRRIERILVDDKWKVNRHPPHVRGRPLPAGKGMALLGMLKLLHNLSIPQIRAVIAKDMHKITLTHHSTYMKSGQTRKARAASFPGHVLLICVCRETPPEDVAPLITWLGERRTH